MINQQDQQQHDQDIGKCIEFIDRIKDHRHNKSKAIHIDKFECLYFKRFGYHYNFTRNTQNFNNIDHNKTLNGQQKVPSSISMTTSNASGNSTAPATPMASTPSASSDPQQHLGTHTPVPVLQKIDISTKSGSSTVQTPLTPGQLALLQKGPNFAITPKYPHGSLHNSSGRGFLQTSIHGSR